jgi:hypothetical protein
MIILSEVLTVSTIDTKYSIHNDTREFINMFKTSLS